MSTKRQQLADRANAIERANRRAEKKEGGHKMAGPTVIDGSLTDLTTGETTPTSLQEEPGPTAQAQAAQIEATAQAAPVPPKLQKRGKSSIGDPVDYVWGYCDARFAQASAAGAEKPRRKDVVNELIARGVAYYTARTQYQAWFKHTNSGTRLMADGNLRPVRNNKPQQD